jgi:hypothetical protein
MCIMPTNTGSFYMTTFRYKIENLLVAMIVIYNVWKLKQNVKKIINRINIELSFEILSYFSILYMYIYRNAKKYNLGLHEMK